MFLRFIPKAAYGIVHEVTRHILKRPVIGVCAVARTKRGEVLLIRRGDNGMWGLPGGTLEWGETLVKGLHRELEEEAGVERLEFKRLLGVWSGPWRDARFHAVTVGVEIEVDPPSKAPLNPLEIREAKLFAIEDLPSELAFAHQDIVDIVRGEKAAVIE